MDIRTLVLLLLQVSLILLVAGIGMHSRWSDLTTAFRQPALLLRGILAVNIVVPLVAYIVVSLLPIDPVIKAGIVIMAVSPMAPFAPGKMLKAGAENSQVVGLYVALIVIAVALVPLTVALLGSATGTETGVPPGEVARFVLVSVLLPLGGGVLLASLFPAAAPRLAKLANLVAYAILLPIVILLLYKAGGPILSLIGNGVLLAIVAAVGAGLAAGHFLGGPETSNRVALASAAATRHPGIAGLVAHHHSNDPRVMLTVVLFLLTSLVVSAIYTAVVTRRARRVAESGLN